MKYRIKNPEVEQAVRGLFKTQEAFEKELNHWSEHHFKYHPYYSCIKIEANSAESITGFTCELYVAASDIEEVVEYDPNGWNEMSVLPPNDGQFLVYCKSEKWFSIWNRYEDHWRNGNWPIFFDNDGDEDLKYFKYRSLDFLKEESEE